MILINLLNLCLAFFSVSQARYGNFSAAQRGDLFEIFATASKHRLICLFLFFPLLRNLSDRHKEKTFSKIYLFYPSLRKLSNRHKEKTFSNAIPFSGKMPNRQQEKIFSTEKKSAMTIAFESRKPDKATIRSYGLKRKAIEKSDKTKSDKTHGNFQSLTKHFFITSETLDITQKELVDSLWSSIKRNDRQSQVKALHSLCRYLGASKKNISLRSPDLSDCILKKKDASFVKRRMYRDLPCYLVTEILSKETSAHKLWISELRRLYSEGFLNNELAVMQSVPYPMVKLSVSHDNPKKEWYFENGFLVSTTTRNEEDIDTFPQVIQDSVNLLRKEWRKASPILSLNFISAPPEWDGDYYYPSQHVVVITSPNFYPENFPLFWDSTIMNPWNEFYPSFDSSIIQKSRAKGLYDIEKFLGNFPDYLHFLAETSRISVFYGDELRIQTDQRDKILNNQIPMSFSTKQEFDKLCYSPLA